MVLGFIADLYLPQPTNQEISTLTTVVGAWPCLSLPREKVLSSYSTRFLKIAVLSPTLYFIYGRYLIINVFSVHDLRLPGRR